MQFLGSLLGSLRQKRSREEDVLLAYPSPHMALSPGSSIDELLIEGYGLRHAAAGGSSAKRRRSDPHCQRQAHALAEASAPPPHCQVRMPSACLCANMPCKLRCSASAMKDCTGHLRLLTRRVAPLASIPTPPGCADPLPAAARACLCRQPAV